MQTITLTSTAAERVRNFLNERGHGVGLRLAVKKTGCSGFAYVVDYADTIGDDDQIFTTNGVKVVVDGKSLPLVQGTKIDFRNTGLGDGFAFENPNVKGECGCGESFAV